MTAILLPSLFAAAAVLALFVLADSAWRFGSAMPALRHQMAACSDVREVRFTLVTHAVMPVSAPVLRGDFRPAARVRPAVARQFRALPVAA